MDIIIYEIDKSQFNDEIKKDLLGIYEGYRNKDNIEKQNLKRNVEVILEKMFKNAYTFSVPMEFINSSLGRMLFEIKLDIRNSTMYGIAELMILSNKSKQSIFNDYNNGNLEGIEFGKKKRVLVTEEAAFKYITTVGRRTFSPEEARRRIAIFNEMNKEDFNEDEIKEALSKV